MAGSTPNVTGAFVRYTRVFKIQNLNLGQRGKKNTFFGFSVLSALINTRLL